MQRCLIGAPLPPAVAACEDLVLAGGVVAKSVIAFQYFHQRFVCYRDHGCPYFTSATSSSQRLEGIGKGSFEPGLVEIGKRIEVIASLAYQYIASGKSIPPSVQDKISNLFAEIDSFSNGDPIGFLRQARLELEQSVNQLEPV